MVGNENNGREHINVTATAINIYNTVAIVSPVTTEIVPYTPKCVSKTIKAWCQKYICRVLEPVFEINPRFLFGTRLITAKPNSEEIA